MNKCHLSIPKQMKKSDTWSFTKPKIRRAARTENLLIYIENGIEFICFSLW